MYHGIFYILEWIFWLFNESIGTKETFVKPQEFSRKGETWDLIWLNLAYDQLTTPIFVTTAIIDWTPKAFANIACSLVWPYFSNPDSNYPYLADIINTAMSAWHAPIIILGT